MALDDPIFDCAPNDIVDAGLRELLAYWEERRGDRRAPQRADIDPVDFPGLLHRVFLIDVSTDPLEMTYRLIGDEIRKRIGFDPRGMSVKEAYVGSGEAWSILEVEYVRVIHDCVPSLRLSEIEDEDSRPFHYERLLLPLIGENGCAAKLLGGVAFRPLHP